MTKDAFFLPNPPCKECLTLPVCKNKAWYNVFEHCDIISDAVGKVAKQFKDTRSRYFFIEYLDLPIQAYCNSFDEKINVMQTEHSIKYSILHINIDSER